MTHNYSHDNRGPGLWDDTDNDNITYAYNRVENNWVGIFHEISYRASIHDNVVRGNSSSNTYLYDNCRWLWCADIQIAASGGINGGLVDIYNNYIVPNWNGVRNGKAVSLIQQNRTDCSRAPACYVQNVTVHDNLIDLSNGNAQHGAVTDTGDNSIFTSRNNTFDRNTYILSTNTSPFNWNNQTGNSTFWRGFGLDVNGTFR
jgi:hypothetical protein